MKHTKLWRSLAGAGVLIVLVAGLVIAVRSSTANDSADQAGLHVVAAENFYGDIAGQIGGSHVQVSSIISDPEADPHLYESSATNAAAVSRADVVIINGVGYDDFMTKLLNGSKNKGRLTITAAKVLNVADNANPHLWYDTAGVNLIARSISDSFSQQDPGHKQEYQTNYQKFSQSLQPLLATQRQIKQKYGGAPVVYTEPVPGYILQNSSLKDATPQGFAKSIEDGSDPSPADTTAMEDLLTSKTARILFYNSQATSPVTEHVRDVAKQAGVPVVGVTETLPPNFKHYQDWQQSQLDQIVAALETK